MLDVLITGGLVVDGTGSPGYFGAVGVDGERVRLIRGRGEEPLPSLLGVRWL